MKDEPNIDQLLAEGFQLIFAVTLCFIGRKSGKTIAVPVFSKTSMHFVNFTSDFDSLPTDKYGIRQESPENKRIENFDLVVVPGRAFTKSE